MLKKILLIILTIITITIIGGYFYISSIDWNKHKDLIAKNFNNATSKEIVFTGPVSLSVFPYPELRAANVKIVNPNAKIDDTPLMTIKSLDSQLELMPLLKGQFNVSLITLFEPEINIVKSKEGIYNWIDGIDEAKIDRLKNANLILKSLTFQNATLNYKDNATNKEFRLTRLKAEALAQSLVGPFNIDGNYIKDRQPGGFSIALGEISNRFSTSINFALSHPGSKTSLRFDGNYSPENDSYTGDVVFTSQELKSFIDANIKDYILDTQYNAPLAFNFEIAKNKEKTDISNIVLAYGNTKGAGNILIPHQSQDQNALPPRIEAAFNFTQLDAEPIAHLIKEIITKKQTIPAAQFNLSSSFQSLKTYYKNEIIKDLSFNLNLNQNIFLLDSFSATLPEESSLNISGDFFIEEPNVLTYSFDTKFETNNLHHILTWLDIPVRKHKNSYKKASFSSIIEGTTDQIKITDINATMDKAKATGSIGIAVDSRPNILFALELDNLNIDDYFSNTSSNNNSLFKNIEEQLSQASILNKFDAQIKSKAKLLIINNTPIHNVDLSANLTLGELDIVDLYAQDLYNTELNLSGIINGFGKQTSLNNIKYKIMSNDFLTFAKNTQISFPIIDLQNINEIEAQGIISGTLQNYNTKAIYKFKDFQTSYIGNIKSNNANTIYNGKIELSSPDFIKFINILGHQYKPKTYSLGNFILEASLKGTKDLFILSNTKAQIGSSIIKGNIAYKNEQKPTISANLAINKFDANKFIYNPTQAKQTQSIFAPTNKEPIFIKKPLFSAEKIDYSFYKTFDLNTDLTINELVINNTTLHNAKLDLEIKEDAIKISNLEAKTNGGSIKANTTISTNNTPQISGDISLFNQTLSPYFNNGTTYGFYAKDFSIKNATFNTSANSLAAAFDGLNIKGAIDFNAAKIKGLDLLGLQNDIYQKNSSENIISTMTNYLQSGVLDLHNISIPINIKDGNFSLKKQISIPNQQVSISTSGSLKDWTMKTIFDISFIDNKDIPSYSFILSPSISNPKLVIIAEQITQALNDKQKEIETKKRIKEENRIKDLQANMNAVQLTAQSIDAELQSLINDNITPKQKTTTNKDIQQEYADLIAQTSQLLIEINKTALYKSSVEYSNDIINSLDKKNDEIKNKASQIKKDLELVYNKDLSSQINDGFKTITNMYNSSKSISRENASNYATTKSKLNSIGSEYNISTNPIIKSNLQSIASYSSQINDAFIKAEEQYNKSNTTSNFAIKQDAANTITKNKKFIEVTLQDLDNSIKAFAKESALIINTEEAKYKAEQAKKLVEEKIKENTGSISVEDKGTMLIKKNIEEIKQIEKEDLKVLDFSNNNKKTIKIKPQITDGIVIIQE